MPVGQKEHSHLFERIPFMANARLLFGDILRMPLLEATGCGQSVSERRQKER